MSKRVLVVSVGGSCDPVVNACNDFRPDYTYFFCSNGPKGSASMVDGPGQPCGSSHTVTCPKCGQKSEVGEPHKKSIVQQLVLAEDQYERIEIDDPDDFKVCFEKLMKLDEEICHRFGEDATVIANYTGGTKTMSTTLSLAAVLLERWDLSVNKGPRTNLIKVCDGDIPVLADKTGVFLVLYEKQAKEFLCRYEYLAADEVLSQLTTRHRLPQDQQENLLRERRLCRAFHLWDLFDHARSLELLRNCGGEWLTPYILCLLDLTGQNQKASGYDRVIDLLLNAERRVAQGRYDDAVARLYRAQEMLAQVRLLTKWGIDTGRVDVAKLPDAIREQYGKMCDSNGRVRLALRDAYSVLAALDDPVGQLWQEREPRLLTALERRNSSVLAHGTIPLQGKEYKAVAASITSFINDALVRLEVRHRCLQLPRSLLEKNTPESTTLLL